MTERTQINFRIDNTLLTAIRDYCDTQNLTQTEFITNALKLAVGMSPTNESDNEAIQQLSNRIAQLEKRLTEKFNIGDNNLTKLIDDRVADALNKLSNRV